MFKSLVIVILYLLVPAMTLYQSPIRTSTLKGVIKTIEGKPLKNVFVYCQNDGSPFAWTNESGNFYFNQRGKVVFAFIKGYKPFIKPLQDDEGEIEIVLEGDSKTKKTLLPCQNTGENNIGGKLQVKVTSNALINFYRGDDAQEVIINYEVSSNNISLNLTWGAMGSVGFPSEKWILGSEKYQVTSFSGGRWNGIDVNGLLKNGNYWRYIGMTREQLTYYNVTKSEAEFLDKILDSVCFRN